MKQEETKNTRFVGALQSGPLVAVICTLYLERPIMQFLNGPNMY